jgi:hypothetical protein
VLVPKLGRACTIVLDYLCKRCLTSATTLTARPSAVFALRTLINSPVATRAAGWRRHAGPRKRQLRRLARRSIHAVPSPPCRSGTSPCATESRRSLQRKVALQSALLSPPLFYCLSSYLKSYIHTYITSCPFPIGVGRDHFLPLATILTHTFRFLQFHQIPHTRSPVSGTRVKSYKNNNIKKHEF